MTDGVNYYKGQRESSYYIGKESSSVDILNMMDNGQVWIFQNGSSATKTLGRFDRYQRSGTVFVYTNSDDAVGTSRTIIRGCSNFNELLELYLYVRVNSNGHPDFVTEVETSWKLALNDTFDYKLPQLVDKEGNDVPEVYIAPYKDKLYPPFLSFNNLTNTLSFRPDSIWYQGNTYQFAIVVKEKNSDVNVYPYYCAVQINGKKIDPLTYLNFTDLTYKIDKITENSTGAIVWSHPVNLTFIKEHFNLMFDVYMKNVTYLYHNSTAPIKDFKITHLGNDSMTMNFTATFYEPYMLGLLIKKKDRLYVHMKWWFLDVNGFIKKDYSWIKPLVIGNVSETRIFPAICRKDIDANIQDKKYGSTTFRERILAQADINLQFDFRNSLMYFWKSYGNNAYWYLCGFVILQTVLLSWRQVGYLPLWTMVEYMQLAAFIPLYNFRLIPYLYDVFKPLLVTHLVLTDKAHILKDMEGDYFDKNYEYYKLNVARLAQALALMCAGAIVVILMNIIIAIGYCATSRESTVGKFFSNTLGQFKFNVYIRYYMLCYFDLTFFAVMKLIEGNDSSPGRRMATIASYVLFTLAMVMPVFFISVICYRFDVLRIKHAKESFNTLILKVDKQSRWRLIVPFYYFFRRILTAVLLSIPISNTFIFLQYVFVLMSSHSYVLYLVAVKPYQTTLFNNYVLANETFYSALIIAIFIFSDATPELDIKIGAAVVLIASVNCMIVANFVMVVVCVWKGRDQLKEDIKQQKLRRAERELMEDEEEEERRQRQ
jgi:hypothetical protein